MIKHLHTLITVVFAIFFIYKGFDKVNSSVSPLNKGDIENIENENYINSEDGEKPSGYKVTKPEGFVAIDTFDNQKGLKLVNRMEFSRINFTAEKEWDQ